MITLYTKFNSILNNLNKYLEYFFEILMKSDGNVKLSLDYMDEQLPYEGLNFDKDLFEQFLFDNGFISETMGNAESGLDSFSLNDFNPFENDSNSLNNDNGVFKNDNIKDFILPHKYNKPTNKGGKNYNPGRKKSYKPTSKTINTIKSKVFKEIMSDVNKSDLFSGSHRSNDIGISSEEFFNIRPYIYGDELKDLDLIGSVSNVMRKQLSDVDYSEDDFQLFERENNTNTANVIAVDISHSMILYGEDRITPAKKVALAFLELGRYHKEDDFTVITFGDEAKKIKNEDVPFINVGPFHTNTKGALELGRQILANKKQKNKRLILITDGKPSAIKTGNRLYINSFGLDARIVNETVNEACKLRKSNIELLTVMITSDPYLKQFVGEMTAAAKGRAIYTDVNNLGKFLLVDYLHSRRKMLH